MSLSEWALHFSNRVVMGCIRRFSTEKERHFHRWFSKISTRGPMLAGRTYFGATLNCEIHDYIPKRIFFFGFWEPEVSGLIASVLEPGDLFVDVGANIGYHSLLASNAVGKAGKVVAIEASSHIFDKLKNNLQRNGVTNVRLVNAAVADREGELTLYAEEGNEGRTSALNRPGSHAIEVVPMQPLDAILSADEMKRVKLIKIDIEGGELPLLERLIETIDLFSPDMRILVEMAEDDSGRSAALFDRFRALGFSAFAVANDYSLQSYLDPVKAAKPEPVDELPAKQTDLYLTRSR